MTDGVNPLSRFRTCVRVQRTSAGRLLCVAVVIPAEIIEEFAKDDTEAIDIEFGVLQEGILLKIGGDSN